MVRAIVLLSGGLDSAVVLGMALEKNRECLALSFDYGQRHRIELEHAKKLADYYKVKHKVIKIDRSVFACSALVGDLEVPKDREVDQIDQLGVPTTYVPGRNTLFLSYAASQAEIFGAHEIYVGPNLLDRIPYPDCRPEFYLAFQQVLNLATKQAIEGHPPRLLTPLIDMDKKAIVSMGRRLGVPLESTFSCYDPAGDGAPCGRCDACKIRALAFADE